MLTQALLAGAEQGINRLLRLDATAAPRLQALAGTVIAIEVTSVPGLQLFILPDGHGLRLARHWQAGADCTLQAPALRLLQLLGQSDKQAVLHAPDVKLQGDSQPLLALSGILQDLELDWEDALAQWLGPVATGILGSQLRQSGRWASQSGQQLHASLKDYLSEESRQLVGSREAQARFAELDHLKLTLDRLEARVQRLTRHRPPRTP